MLFVLIKLAYKYNAIQNIADKYPIQNFMLVYCRFKILLELFFIKPCILVTEKTFVSLFCYFRDLVRLGLHDHKISCRYSAVQIEKGVF